MLELYEQNKMPQGSEIEGSGGAAHSQRGSVRNSALNDEHVPSNGHAPAGAGSMSSSAKPGASKQTPTISGGADYAENHNAQLKSDPNPEKDNGSTEISSVVTEQKLDREANDNHNVELSLKDDTVEASKVSNAEVDKMVDNGGGKDGLSINESDEAGELKENAIVPKPFSGRSKDSAEGPDGRSPQVARQRIDFDKLKAVVEKKKKKSRPDIPRRKDAVDEDDLIERALEDGVELAIEDERIKRGRRQSWSKEETYHHSKDHESRDNSKGQSSRGTGGAEFVEEGEMLDDSSPMFNARKRKGSPLEKSSDIKHRREYDSGNPRSHHDTREDGHRNSRGGGYADREHRKHT